MELGGGRPDREVVHVDGGDRLRRIGLGGDPDGGDRQDDERQRRPAGRTAGPARWSGGPVSPPGRRSLVTPQIIAAARRPVVPGRAVAPAGPEPPVEPGGRGGRSGRHRRAGASRAEGDVDDRSRHRRGPARGAGRRRRRRRPPRPLRPRSTRPRTAVASQRHRPFVGLAVGDAAVERHPEREDAAVAARAASTPCRRVKRRWPPSARRASGGPVPAPTVGRGRAGGGLEDGVAEGEDLGVGGGDPVALPARRRRQADGGHRQREHLAPEGGVAEGRRPLRRRTGPSSPCRSASARCGRPASGAARPARRANGASPKAKTPPSAPTIQ